MLWIESVCSTQNQSVKTAASTTTNNTVDITYGTPKPTCSTSAAMVPNTPTIATANQYVAGRYAGARSCTPSATTKTTKPSSTAATGGMACARKSDADSPNAVVSSFAAQKPTVISGTLTSMLRSAARRVCVTVISPPSEPSVRALTLSSSALPGRCGC